MDDQDHDRLNYSNSTFYDCLQYIPQPIYIIFFLGVTLFLLIFKWYINYESMFEDMMEKLKLCLVVFPVLLLLVVHGLSSENKERVPFFLSLPEEPDAFHKLGGSPFGVGILLIVILFMVPHHASIHERWFPLFSRR